MRFASSILKPRWGERLLPGRKNAGANKRTETGCFKRRRRAIPKSEPHSSAPARKAARRSCASPLPQVRAHTLFGTCAAKHSELQGRAENVLRNNSPPQITLSRPLPSPYTPKPPGCAVSAYSDLVHGMPGSQRTGSGKRCPCRGDGHAQPTAHRRKDAVLPTLHHRKSSQRAFLLKLVQNRDTTKPCYLRFAYLKLQRSRKTHGREKENRVQTDLDVRAAQRGRSGSPELARGHAHRARPAHWGPPIGAPK